MKKLAYNLRNPVDAQWWAEDTRFAPPADPALTVNPTVENYLNVREIQESKSNDRSNAH